MIGKCILLLPIFYYLLPYLFWKTVPLNQIPNTDNQQPTTDNQQPTTYHYTFIDILLLIGSILATYETSVT